MIYALLITNLAALFWALRLWGQKEQLICTAHYWEQMYNSEPLRLPA